MTIEALPFAQGHASVRGVGAGVSLPVPAIRAGDTLLAVVKHNAATGVCVGLDVSAFVVSNGAIQSASLATTGHYVAVLWYESRGL